MSKSKIYLSIIFLILILAWILLYTVSNKKNLTVEETINNIKWIENINRDNKICVQIKNWNKKSIDCFIPNKIKDYQELYWYSNEDIIKIFKQAEITKNKILSFEEKPLFYQIFDKIQPNISNLDNIIPTYKEIKAKLEFIIKKNEWVMDEWLSYYYIKNLEWNYKEAVEFKDKICKKFKYLCEKDIVFLNIKWKILDNNKRPIVWAKIQLAWTNKIAISQSDWQYYFSEFISPFTKARLLAHKEGYSYWVGNFNIISPVKKQSFNKDFILNESNNITEINTINKTIKWKNTNIDWNYYIVRTEWSEYKIPFNAIVNEKWDIFKWKLKVYTWDFNKQSDLTNLVNSDIFDEVSWYAWDLMKTFGMPFIMFISEKWDKLHVLKSNPMILKTRVQEMSALKTNQDKIYTELTDKDMEFLVNKSQELWWYPIDRMFLINNNILRFPAFWVFDQYKWIWENVWMKVLNKEWDWELLFYTLSEVNK